jgi:hypothetical protein
VEGVNIGGILLGYVAVLVFGVTSLVALGLLIARLKAALIVFAAGMLCADLIAALAVLSCLEFNPDASETAEIVLATLSLVLSGTGQFIAALRRGWVYVVALGCAGASIVFLVFPLTGYPVADVFGDLDPHLAFKLSSSFSVLFAVASLLVALLFPSGQRMERQGVGP